MTCIQKQMRNGHHQNLQKQEMYIMLKIMFATNYCKINLQESHRYNTMMQCFGQRHAII